MSDQFSILYGIVRVRFVLFYLILVFCFCCWFCCSQPYRNQFSCVSLISLVFRFHLTYFIHSWFFAFVHLFWFFFIFSFLPFHHVLFVCSCGIETMEILGESSFIRTERTRSLSANTQKELVKLLAVDADTRRTLRLEGDQPCNMMDEIRNENRQVIVKSTRFMTANSIIARGSTSTSF